MFGIVFAFTVDSHDDDNVVDELSWDETQNATLSLGTTFKCA